MNIETIISVKTDYVSMRVTRKLQGRLVYKKMHSGGRCTDIEIGNKRFIHHRFDCKSEPQGRTQKPFRTGNASPALYSMKGTAEGDFYVLEYWTVLVFLRRDLCQRTTKTG